MDRADADAVQEQDDRTPDEQRQPAGQRPADDLIESHESPSIRAASTRSQPPRAVADRQSRTRIAASAEVAMRRAPRAMDAVLGESACARDRAAGQDCVSKARTRLSERVIIAKRQTDAIEPP